MDTLKADVSTGWEWEDASIGRFLSKVGPGHDFYRMNGEP